MATSSPDGVHIVDENGTVVGYVDDQPSGQILRKPEDPYRARQDAREAERLRLAQIEAARAAAKDALQASRESLPNLKPGYMWKPGREGIEAMPVPGMDETKIKPLRQGDGDNLEGDVGTYAALKGSLQNFNPEYGGNKITGEAENMLQGMFDVGTPGQRDWWANFRNTDNIIRNSLYGASLTAGEKQAYDQTTITPRMRPEEIQKNITRRAEIIRKAVGRKVNRFKAAGYNPDEIDAITGEYGADFNPPEKQEDKTINTGAFQTNKIPPPPGMEQELSTWARANARKMTADMYLSKLNELSKKYNFGNKYGLFSFGDERHGGQILDPEVYKIQMELAEKWAEAARKGKINTAIVPGEEKVPISEWDQGRAKFANSELGTLAANYFNAAGMGIPQLLAGDDPFKAMAAENPNSALLGEIAGSITGSNLLSKGGAKIAGKFAPKLLGGGAKAQFGRNLLTDTVYGGVYGGNTTGDYAGGAAGGLLGSAGGQAAGKVIGAGLRGGGSRAAQYLQSQGVPVTFGGAVRNTGTLGNMISGAEDRMAGFPFIGDIVGARRNEGLSAWRGAVGNEAISPLGVRVSGDGDTLIGNLHRATEKGYSDALDGVTIRPDAQAVSDMAAVAQRGHAIDASRPSKDFGMFMDNQISPILVNTPQVDGRAIADMLRASKTEGAAFRRAAASGQDPSAKYVADTLGGFNDAVKGLASRSDPNIIPGLDRADDAYHGVSILDNAALRAMNQGGEFTPAQLGMSIKADPFASKRQISEGNFRFKGLQRAGQSVFPSTVPDSGTAGRIALAGIGLGGAGLGASTSDNPVTGAGAGTLATITTLAALGTKQGQKALVAALMKRSTAMKKMGRKIVRNKGLFGSAAVPLALPSQE